MIAIYFHPEAYSISGPRLMGRNAAGESFLRGFVRHAKTDAFWAQVEKPEHAKAFAAAVQSAGRPEPVRALTNTGLAALAQVGAVYYPGPGIGQHAWRRGLFGHEKWSLVGITHTTASAGAMDAIEELITAPVQPWDAVICTSRAVKNNVERVLQAQADHLGQRLGATRLVLPRMPVIPLGIHTEDFVFTEAQRSQARQAIGADEQTLVVLFIGRLSFHAKAHPLAMYQALELAAEGRKVVLVECGWHANDYIRNAFTEAARSACPSVRVVTLDGRNAQDRATAWASADVFCSLSENIQETFGITPIEAMADGLPVVVSDWDGYKDTVRDGVDGFVIPTLMPPAGLGGDLAAAHALETDTYDMYCGHSCTFCAVDVQTTAEAFRRLFASPGLRRQMGGEGRKRARAEYDWAAIIPRYEALCEELAGIRRQEADKLPKLSHPWPARMDPFAAFSSYPTRTLTPETILELALPDAVKKLACWRSLAMVDFAKRVLPTQEECEAVLDALSSGPRPAGELVQRLPPGRQAFVFRALAWMVKMGVLRVVA
ncbi:MAG: glycosyltransferase family 4 protein [Candidatus Latescibacterota bacterium]